MRKKCEVCKKPIVEGDEYVAHGRLRVYVHARCPKTDVKGENIEGHTMLWRVEED